MYSVLILLLLTAVPKKSFVKYVKLATVKFKYLLATSSSETPFVCASELGKIAPKTSSEEPGSPIDDGTMTAYPCDVKKLIMYGCIISVHL